MWESDIAKIDNRVSSWMCLFLLQYRVWMRLLRLRLRRCLCGSEGVLWLASRVAAVVIGMSDALSVVVALLLVMILLCECKAWGEAYLPLKFLFLQRLEYKALRSSVTEALRKSLMFLKVASGQVDLSCSCSVLDMLVSISSSAETTFYWGVMSSLEENVDHQYRMKVCTYYRFRWHATLENKTKSRINENGGNRKSLGNDLVCLMIIAIWNMVFIAGNFKFTSPEAMVINSLVSGVFLEKKLKPQCSSKTLFHYKLILKYM